MKLVRIVFVLVDRVVVSLRRLLGAWRQNMYLWRLCVYWDASGDDGLTLDNLSLRNALRVGLRMVVDNLMLDDLSLRTGVRLLRLHAWVVVMRLLRQILLWVIGIDLAILLVVMGLLLLHAIVEHASQKETNEGANQKAEH